jgi:hypothetical protein
MSMFPINPRIIQGRWRQTLATIESYRTLPDTNRGRYSGVNCWKVFVSACALFLSYNARSARSVNCVQQGFCPRCGGTNVRRSHRRGFLERVFLWLRRRRPYRCEACDKRFLLPDSANMGLTTERSRSHSDHESSRSSRESSRSSRESRRSASRW